MGFEELPSVSFTVEGLKTKVLHTMSMLTDDMNKVVAEQVEKAVADYNWEQHIRELTDKCIREQLEHYFTYGEGYKQIKSAIERGFGQR